MSESKRIFFIGMSLLQDVVVQLLAEQPEIEVIGTADTWGNAKEQIVRDAPDVIIMDHQNQELVEAELNPLLGSIQHPLKVIYLTPAENRIIVHDRIEIFDASVPDLVNVLSSSIKRDAKS